MQDDARIRSRVMNQEQKQDSATAEFLASGHGYAVKLERGFACGDVGAPVFIHYRHRGAADFARALKGHGLRGRVVRVEWGVREVRP